MNARTRPFGLVLWGLLFLWIFFGGLELGEQLQVVPETAMEDEQGQDPDEEALAKLASGLKSDVTTLLALSDAFVLVERSKPTISHLFSTVHQFTWLNAAPVLPLYQQYSVYRI